MSVPPEQVPLERSVYMADPRRRPSTKAPRLWATVAVLLWLPLFAAQIVWALLDGRWTTWPHVTVFGVSVVAAAFEIVVVPRWRYHVHRWEISDDAVYTRTGWFNQERRIAPLTRIQTVDTERGPLDRLFGLATVTVTTASSAGAVKIAALDLDVADRAVEHLTAVAARNRGDAT